jgi:hypothetical protein
MGTATLAIGKILFILWNSSLTTGFPVSRKAIGSTAVHM